ncbi:MAG: hypothetical protein RDU20_18395 [Desulfomonilaceae bacterium]|nr:hypothetical protein [Desulfomonilaceae bacterium]
MFAFLRPYITIVKLWALIVSILAVFAYVAALKYMISHQRETIRFLEESVASCDRDRSKLRAAYRLQSHNLGALDAYYRSRKCLNLHDGSLSDREMSLK